MKKKLLILSVIAATLFTTNSYAYTTVNSPKWVQEGNEWRLIDTSTGMMVYTDIAYVGSNDTYIFENGYMVHDRWITMYNKYQYYCGSDGRVLKNAITPDGYEVDSQGRYIKDGFPIQDESYVPKELYFRVSANEYMTESGDSKTTSESYNFWGTDETLAYSALKSLYKSLKDPTSLKLKDITCITYDSRLGSGEEIITRTAVITYYAANSFGGMVKNQYAYESRSNGTVYDGDYDYITPYRVLQGDYRDVHAIENAQEILSRVEKEYWGK